MNTELSIAERVEQCNEAVANACQRHGREGVRIMAVSKTRSAREVEVAHQAGITLFGENRVQEARSKFEQALQYELHLIGHLQRNKAAQAVALFSCVQSIDKWETAEALNVQAEKQDRIIDIMLQLNVSREAGKHGLPTVSELLSLADRLPVLTKLRCTGLMAVGPHPSTPKEQAVCFAELRKAGEKLAREHPEFPLKELSMGMSDDYDVAIAEGSTMLRLGTAIFSERSKAKTIL